LIFNNYKKFFVTIHSVAVNSN